MGNESRLNELKEYIKEIGYLMHAQGVINWDMETYIPEEAVQGRIEVLGYLYGQSIKILISPEMGACLNELSKEKDSLGFEDRRMVEEVKREYDNLTNVPIEKSKELQMACARSDAFWKKAKENNDYQGFKPYLSDVVRLTKEIAAYKSHEGDIYDKLLDDYERGFTTEKLDMIFKELREGIVDLLHRIKKSNVVIDDSFFKKNFDEKRQDEFGKYVLEKMGFDFKAGRLDTTVHPFTTNMGNKDVRITTNYEHPDFRSAIFSDIHEGGHGIYEQNSSDYLEQYGLGGGVSMGIHESQSRFYENILGRSKEFWTSLYPELQRVFPEFKEVSLEDFYKGINKVEPSFIRTEADELTYSLHIIIRYELEKALINGDITLDELPDEWNKKYKEYLGVEPKNFSEGVLQDTHWASGLIGYFPSYALGNLYGAQLLNKIKSDIPNYEEEISKGNIMIVTKWLNENIHKYGKLYTPTELIVRVTGEELNPKYFLDYLNKKYSVIYDI